MGKIRLIRKLTDTGYNLMSQGCQAVKEFLASERDREERERLEYERQQKEKDRILRRIMDANVRWMGIGFRQAYQWMEADRDADRLRMYKQRGIMRRIIDANTRLMSAGYNKLLEDAKMRKQQLMEKLRFVIKSLTDKDARDILMAYNQVKQNWLKLIGVGYEGDVAQKLKIRLIRKLTDTGYNLMSQGCQAVKEFLASERD